MKYLFLAVFAVALAVHLYASSKLDQHLRNLTKPFLLLSLLGYYLFSAGRISSVVVLALVFSWLGDVILMLRGNRWFAVGGVTFFVSHLFFILSYFPDVDFSALSPVFTVICGILFAAVVVIIFSQLKPRLPHALFFPMLGYLLVNGAMNCFALYRYVSCLTVPALLTCIGAVLFFISDSTLFFIRFPKEGRPEPSHFWVMLTYSIGELLIVLGLL